MPTSPVKAVIQHLLADLGSDGDGLTDGELLARFLSSRDEDALAALVRRHARMVWGVCRRLLNHHDAEDAFQAALLVLVRKAADVPRQAVANWLYGVARQTAVRLRAMAAKRGRRETQVVTMPEPSVPEVRDADLPRVVDEELSRLPDHFTLVVRVRNVGKKEVEFQYLKEFFKENPPLVTNADGKKLPGYKILFTPLKHVPEEVSLAPGKEIELSSEQYQLMPATERGKGHSGRFPALWVGTGKVSVQYNRLFGNTSAGRIKVDPDFLDLTTGSLELEIKPAPPPATEKK